MKKKKNEFNIENLEDFEIIFMGSSPNKKNNEEHQKIFKIYQEQLEKLSESREYKTIKLNSAEKDGISEKLNNIIYTSFKNKLSIPNNDNIIFIIEGPNKSCKQNLENYLVNQYNALKLNINFFIFEICNRYNIKEDDLNLNESKYLSILESEKISSFIKYHNSQKFIILDCKEYSSHILYLKNIFNENLKIIFIESKENNTNQEINRIKIYSNYIVAEDIIAENIMTQIDHIISQTNIQKKVDLKGIDEFNIPFKFKQLLEQLYREILNKFDVKLFILHGSCSTETVIENYSDIDLILVIEPNDINTRKLMKEIISNCKYGIKVGTTIYNKKEFESLQVDFKTHYCIYLINNNKNFPLFISDINIPIVNKYSMILMAKSLIPGKIHELRRLLYNEKTNQFDDIFKKLAHLMKNYLLVEEIEPKGYFKLYKTFSEVFKLDEFDVNKYFQDDNYKKEIIKYCNYVIDKIDISFESINKKRKAVRGIILKDDNIILIHRIKEDKEYYVYPGGGIENGETNEQCITREIKQELGIEVKTLNYLYRLEEEKDIEYYYLCQYLQGEIGTGTGPEFTDEKYINNGKYIPKIHKIKEIAKLDLKKNITNTFLIDIEKNKVMTNIPFQNIINI